MQNAPIFVTFALPQESQDFRQALRRRNKREVRVEHFGVGPAIAAKRVKQLLATQKPRLLICAGFAGGLDPQLAIGDLVIAENLSTPEILAQVRATTEPSGPRCVLGTIISRSLPVESVVDKAALFRETGALAVDMESEAVAAACRAASVPLLVVRTISDPAGDDLPVPFADWFEIQRQQPGVFRLLKCLALHPSRIAPFARFVRGLAPARATLAGFLVRFISEFDLNQPTN